MALINNLNQTTSVEGEMGEYAPALPDGTYQMLLKGWPEAETQQRDIRVNFDFVVAEGELRGRTYTERLTAFSSKPGSNAGVFFQRFMKSLTRALGMPAGLRIDDALLNSLVNKRVVAEIVTEEGRINEKTGKPYPPRNSIKKFHTLGAAAETAPQAAPMMPPMQHQTPQGIVMLPQASAPAQPPMGYQGHPPQAYAPQPMTAPMAPAAMPQPAGNLPGWMVQGQNA